MARARSRDSPVSREADEVRLSVDGREYARASSPTGVAADPLATRRDDEPSAELGRLAIACGERSNLRRAIRSTVTSSRLERSFLPLGLQAHPQRDTRMQVQHDREKWRGLSLPLEAQRDSGRSRQTMSIAVDRPIRESASLFPTSG